MPTDKKKQRSLKEIHEIVSSNKSLKGEKISEEELNIWYKYIGTPNKILLNNDVQLKDDVGRDIHYLDKDYLNKVKELDLNTTYAQYSEDLRGQSPEPKKEIIRPNINYDTTTGYTVSPDQKKIMLEKSQEPDIILDKEMQVGRGTVDMRYRTEGQSGYVPPMANFDYYPPENHYVNPMSNRKYGGDLHKYWQGGALAGAGKGASMGAAIGNLIPIPGVGAAIGAGVGALAGGIIGGVREHKNDKADLEARRIQTMNDSDKYEATSEMHDNVRRNENFNTSLNVGEQALNMGVGAAESYLNTDGVGAAGNMGEVDMKYGGDLPPTGGDDNPLAKELKRRNVYEKDLPNKVKPYTPTANDFKYNMDPVTGQEGIYLKGDFNVADSTTAIPNVDEDIKLLWKNGNPYPVNTNSRKTRNNKLVDEYFPQTFTDKKGKIVPYYNTPFKKYGGNLPTKETGGDMIEYDGATHDELNQYGTTGIPVNEQGVPTNPNNAVAEVEDGETFEKDYIFSDSLKVPNKKHTFSDAHKNLDKKYKNRDSDKFEKNSYEIEFQSLINSQEDLKAKKAEYHRKKLEELGATTPDALENQEPQYEYGGGLKDFIQGRNKTKDARSDQYFQTMVDEEGNVIEGTREGVPVSSKWLGDNYTVDYTEPTPIAYKTMKDRWSNLRNKKRSSIVMNYGGNLPQYPLGGSVVDPSAYMNEQEVSGIDYNQSFLGQNPNEFNFNKKSGIEDDFNEGDNEFNFNKKSGLEYEGAQVSPFALAASNVGNIYDMAQMSKKRGDQKSQQYNLDSVNFEAAKTSAREQAGRSRSALRNQASRMGAGAGAAMSAIASGNAGINQQTGKFVSDIDMQENLSNTEIRNKEGMLNTQLAHTDMDANLQDYWKRQSVKSGALHGMGQNTMGYMRDERAYDSNNDYNEAYMKLINQGSRYGYGYDKDYNINKK